uniref:Uncharacterized protein n=1 Tax=Arundo donax TaxID=35708 RepID=A0A0A9ETA0_ARUDO
MTSNDVETLGSTGDLFIDTSALLDLDDLELFGNDLESILETEQDCPMEAQQNSQVDPPLTIQDYYDCPQLEQDCQMEVQENYKNPQYADVITEA